MWQASEKGAARLSMSSKWSNSALKMLHWGYAFKVDMGRVFLI
jgi:hypothetical protein